MFEKVAAVIAEYKDIDVSQITMESSFADLKVDSLDTVELIMKLEDDLDIAIELNDKVTTVGSLVELLENA